MLAAIILAAGDSTRMGRPKALLPDPDGRPFVARLVRTFAAAGLHDIVVVTGSLHAAIADAVAADQPPVAPTLVNNPQPALGQVSSLWMGLDAVASAGHRGRARDARRHSTRARVDSSTRDRCLDAEPGADRPAGGW